MLLKLSEYPAIKIQETIRFDWTNPQEDTKEKLTTYLSDNNKNIDVVTAHFGEPLVGATLAVEDLGLGDHIKVIGIDAFQPVINLMKQGKCVIAAVQQDAYAMGIVAAKLSMKILHGKKVAYQYILPLTNIYANFPNRVDNYPENDIIKITCPSHFKEAGLNWGY